MARETVVLDLDGSTLHKLMLDLSEEMLPGQLPTGFGLATLDSRTFRVELKGKALKIIKRKITKYSIEDCYRLL